MLRRLIAIALAAILGPSIGACRAAADDIDHYALLMVWMPGLCKLESDRAECKGLTLRRYDGLNLAFLALQTARASGLANTFCFTMPSDSEMDRERQWCDMDKVSLNGDLAADLQTLMPVAQSCQDRGLWARYASCTLYSADDYYSRAFRLAKTVAATRMNAKIAGAVGSTVSQQKLLEAFQSDFGDQAGTAIDFICREVAGQSHLLQVRISIAARALSQGLKPDLLWHPHGALRRSCPETITVDAPPVPLTDAGGTPTAPNDQGGDQGNSQGTAAPAGSPPGAPVIPQVINPEPIAPQSAPIGPVTIEPLSPPTQ